MPKADDLALPRNGMEQLVRDIVEQTDAKGAQARKLQKLLVIQAKALRWSMTDLHALLQKKKDPAIRNYSAFVWSHVKTRTKR